MPTQTQQVEEPDAPIETPAEPPDLIDEVLAYIIGYDDDGDDESQKTSPASSTPSPSYRHRHP